MFPTFDIFCQVMDQCTENYECLVIDNTSKSNKIEDQVYWYKASEHENFKIGAPEFWEHHNIKFNDDEDEDESFNISNLSKKGLTINVKKTY